MSAPRKVPTPSAATRPRSPVARWIAEMSVGRLLAATIGLLLVLAVVGIGLALLASAQLTRDRRLLLDQVGPARRTALSLENALINEETGVRGYLITGESSFLEPYRSGSAGEALAYAELRAREHAVGPAVAADVELVRARARAWREDFVTPALAHGRQPANRSIIEDVAGKRLFDAIRASLTRLQSALVREDSHTRAQLESAADNLQLLLILAGVLILGGVLAAGVLLRRTITLPLERLGAEARRVAGGEFARPLAVASGPREVAEVGAEIDAMRERIVTELASVESAHARLETQAGELKRSNAELEQFAYVASHDLQEPLRKVVSFCQALETRYRGQLDERADQYIDFAVDGAKRMQSLINDLLAFSRVGRSGRKLEPVALGDVLAAVRSALAESLARRGARVEADELPTIRGDRAQLISLFQNLISNAVKFHGAEPPAVRISVRREGEQWQLAFADKGIGIDPEYAERIFLIFQRLHARDAYDGSGIGLALCRKIVEYHGGRIWLDTDYAGGACFRLTLPIAKEAVQ
ncbi:MAG TPA: ATP-binding protein [Solirubrobacteraceae bacterium]|jgi:signal transduction histidine kinase|nr:ATP-binding protein [Solirubrobacteraceae bacterium]